jgi:hypothetical protein
MLLKCMYKRLPIWDDSLRRRIATIEAGATVLSLDEEKQDSLPDLYIKIFYNDTIGWSLKRCFKSFEDS